MNIINKAILKIVLLPAAIYERAGISVHHLRTILHYKLLIDDRRPSSIQQTGFGGRNKDKKQSNSSIISIVFSAFIGLLLLFSFAIGNDPLIQMTFYFSQFITMVCMVLVSDFTSVLIDVKDNMIILPKPVNDKTVVVARLLHILIHICKTILPMGIPAIVLVGVKMGVIASCIFFIVILLATLFAIFVINAVYILILRITTPDKFKNIIGYIQIFFAILVYASSQILPRMMGRLEGLIIQIHHAQWLILLPPYWFAATFQLLHSPTSLQGIQQLIAGIAGLVLPWISIYVVVKYLAPSFNQKLSMISGSDDAAPISAQQKGKKGNKGYLHFVSHLLTGSTIELSGFVFAWKIMNRSRDFKMKVYPSFGYMLVLVFITFFSRDNVTLQSFRTEKGIMPLLFMAYFLSLAILTAIHQMLLSEKYKAAWVFFVTPIQRPGEFIGGAIKAAISSFYLPTVLFLIVVTTVLCGPSALPNMFLAMSNQLVIIYLICLLSTKSFPFSKPSTQVDQGMGNLARSMLRLIICVFVAGLHFLIYQNTLIVCIVLPISVTVLYYLVKSAKDVSWHEIKYDMANY